jgi:DNA-binding MarR family transcriptional regulator
MSVHLTPSFGQRPLLTVDQVAGEAVFVAVMRVANALTRRFDELIKPHGLTGPQYNALRVLRDAGETGMACQELGSRLIAHDPDITRLADRLEERGLITKNRGIKDRRVVMLRMTPAGLKLMSELDDLVIKAHEEHASMLTLAQKQELTHLLNLVLCSNSAPRCPSVSEE